MEELFWVCSISFAMSLPLLIFVAGDKSNHVATLHLAQMLYIWPLFAFFSAPLLIPTAASLFSRVLQTTLPGQNPGKPLEPSTTTATAVSKKAQPGRTNQEKSGSQLQKSSALRNTEFLCQNTFSALFVVGVIALSLAIVKYNTIIHPFTLADNRHYMFYVFRYTILRSTAARFSLVGGYAVSALLVWNRLCGCPGALLEETNPDCPMERDGPVPFINTPFPSAAMSKDRSNSKSTGPQGPMPNDIGSPNIIVTLDNPTSTSTQSPPTSTGLLWLLTTSLSLITAPLVEPRYFILPWIFWRLLVPAWPAHECQPDGVLGAQLSRVPGMSWLYRQGRKFDLTVGLETLWFLLINAATMYMFLYRPFVWRNGDGEVLDGGRMQRFMW